MFNEIIDFVQKYLYFGMMVFGLIVIFYGIFRMNRVEKNGTKEERIANQKAMVFTTKAFLYLTALQLTFGVLTYVLNGFDGNLTYETFVNKYFQVSTLVLGIAYFSALDFYSRSKKDQEKMTEQILGSALTQKGKKR
ncbi:hypothetical protein BAU15_12115 [Enterococcus sp. JM4C]|uniref:hypothetical protein n=1 Tax=Candidatus Enterococcus huntleyi TaxID=1857217 RepID=UPI001379B199|nr:hypothetical protein [Enterococcus sp. JM4C]KAF1296023.1 hypothetical protein BAU15_12115 [Enterococcus sp. JM4C]